MKTDILRVEGLCLSLNNGKEWQQVLKDISFSLSKGKKLGIAGPSGAGKTQLIRALGGFLPKGLARIDHGAVIYHSDGSGEINLWGVSQKKRLAWRAGEVGFIPQDPVSALNPGKTVLSHLKEAVSGLQVDRENMVQKLADLGFATPEALLTLFPHQLSGGMAQRVHLAAALLKNPSLILADEPTHALDKHTASEILRLLARSCDEQGRSLIIISHQPESLLGLVDEVMFIENSAVVFKREAKELVQGPGAEPAWMKFASPIPKMSKDKALINNPSKPILEARSLSKSFLSSGKMFATKRKKILKNLHLKLNQGEVIGLVGITGSGKSTLAACLLGLERPEEGQVYFDGKEIQTLLDHGNPSWRREIQWVPQDNFQTFHPYKRIKKVLETPLKIHEKLGKTERSKKVYEVLEKVGLGEKLLDRFPHQLSSGQRQRVNLARALVLKPKVLILDEPVSALDPPVKSQILELLKGIQTQDQITMLLITHDWQILEVLADQVAVLQDGMIIEQGPLEQIQSKPVMDYTRSLIRAAGISS